MRVYCFDMECHLNKPFWSEGRPIGICKLVPKPKNVCMLVLIIFIEKNEWDNTHVLVDS